jgi:hypothetical protein
VPKRIQLSRKRGSRLPEGAKSVARPSLFGNPFRVGGYVVGERGRPPYPWPQDMPLIESTPGLRQVRDRADAVALFIAWVPHVRDADTGLSYAELAQRSLAGRDLACWCPDGEPCHGDQLVALAAGRRMSTPDVTLPDGGRRVAVKRCCNGCGETIGDVTDAEISAGIGGQPLPDVRGECPRCSVELERANA